MIIFYKNQDIKISDNFNSNEFQCHCDDDHANYVSSTLLAKLELLRLLIGRPIHVTSGYRCDSHNHSLENASPSSLHKVGMAADIICRWESLDFMEYVADIARKIGFDEVILYPETKVVHVAYYGDL